MVVLEGGVFLLSEVPLYPETCTLNRKPGTLSTSWVEILPDQFIRRGPQFYHPGASTLNPQPSTLSTEHAILHPQLSNFHPQPYTLNLGALTLNTNP